MSNEICKTCKGPKAKYQCGICQECTCKKCTQFQVETFSYLIKIPEILTHSQYCSQCFEEHIASELQDYQQTVEEAKEIVVFSKEYTKQTRLLNRRAEVLKVFDCEDEEDAMMKMSFQAVKLGYNSIIDVEFKNKKVINGSHKRFIVDATSIPSTIDKNKQYHD